MFPLQALSVHDILLAMGLRSTGLAAACTLPLLLTALLFAGPLLMSWLDRRPSGPKRGPLLSPLAIRSYIAAPITEEAWFRCGLCSYLLLSGVSQARCIWLAPALFGASHLHHAADQVTHQGWPLRQALAVSAFQFCYTSVFGWFAGFLLLRTGHMAAVVAVHSFCNFMGLPMFGAVPSHKKATLLAATYLAGIAAFAALLLPLTQPQLYGYPAGQSFATTVVQLPSKMGLPAL